MIRVFRPYGAARIERVLGLEMAMRGERNGIEPPSPPYSDDNAARARAVTCAAFVMPAHFSSSLSAGKAGFTA